MDETKDKEKAYQVVPKDQLPPAVTAPKPAERKSFTDQLGLAELVKASGKLKLTDHQKEVLYADFEDNLVEIKSDGIIFLPWVFYSQRLFAAFGMEWALVPLDNPVIKGNVVAVHYGLVIKGAFIADAWGDTKYWESNPMMTYTDCIEGAKSDCLRRLCKAMGIGLKLWEPEYIRSWKDKYAESYQVGGKVKWRKRKEAPKTGERGAVSQTATSTTGTVSQGPPCKPEERTSTGRGDTLPGSTVVQAPSGLQGSLEKEKREFAREVLEYTHGVEFHEWGRAHAIHNLKDVKDMLEVFYNVSDLRTITLDQLHDWMAYIEDTDLESMSEEGDNAIRRGQDSGTSGSTDKLNGGARQGELSEG